MNDGKAIKEKLLSVDYSEYSAEIKTVDAQESLDGGVTVLVTGYLTGNDDVKKKFTQSFLLATQDKGYYVLNDIFRFRDEANDQPSSSALTSGDSEPLAPEQGIILDFKVACSLNPVPRPDNLVLNLLFFYDLWQLSNWNNMKTRYQKKKNWMKLKLLILQLRFLVVSRRKCKQEKRLMKFIKVFRQLL